MVSIALFVLLLATYAYSVPVGMNDNIIKQKNISQPIVMHLMDDGESTPVPTSSQVTLTTGKVGLQITTSDSIVNNARAPREMMPASQVELSERGVQLSNPEVELGERGVKDSDPLLQLGERGVKDSDPLLQLGERGIEESSTLFPSVVETSTQFNQRKIYGQNVQSGMGLQKTEEPTSSVSSFATQTGLLRPLRGEETDEQESTSMSMDETSTEFTSTGQSNTVIEIIPGRNTKTEIIPGPNTKTEIIPGPNTKTEIITNNSGRLVGGNRALSQGEN